MGARTNRSATLRTVRALRQAEHLTDAHAGLVELALSTARALDEVMVSDERRYVIAQLARAHLLAVEALLALPGPEGPDNFEALLSALTVPGAGASDEAGRFG